AGDGELKVRWTATDRALAQNPIAVSVAPTESGPWRVLRGDLANTGSFSCSTRGLPAEFYLRVEARDEAGNVGTAQSKESVKLEVKVPRARVEGVMADE